MSNVSRSSLLLAPTAAAVILLAIGLATHRAVRHTLAASVANELETVLNANVTALEIWIHTQERTAAVLARHPALLPLCEQLLATGPPVPSSNGPPRPPPPALGAFQEILEQSLGPAGFGAAQLVNRDLQVVAASGRGRSRPGAIVPEEHLARFEELFATDQPVLVTPFKLAPPRRGPPDRDTGRFFRRPPPALNNSPVFHPPDASRSRPSFANRPEIKLMQILTPVRDPEGRTIGALAFILRPEDEFTRVLSVARPGDTGETFAFDPSGLIISQSRFDDQLRQLGLLTNAPDANSALTLELRDPGRNLTLARPPFDPPGPDAPLMPLVAAAVAETSGVTVVPSPDYRGVPVVGAWRWLPDRRFGVVTKIDAAEAFQPLRVIERVFLVLLLLLALAALGITIFTGLNARWRRRFHEAQLKARRLGQYTLDEEIGEGCMGVVYRAHHALLRRDTAVKLLLPHRADPDLIRQFEHEVRLTCQLSHPNTIQVYDYGHTPDGIFYYAMELLHGLTFQDLVERHGPQPEERVVHLLAQVCGSLQEAHQAGLIHRDIKPGNLFLCHRGGIPDTVKVLDFGLVQRLPQDPATTPQNRPGPDTSRFLGTPLYLAPESIRQPGFGDPRTDLYALGAVGYFLLSAQPLFVCSSIDSLWEHQLTTNPEPIATRTPLPVSPAIAAAIHACLHKDPARRPQSAAEFLQLLLLSPLSGAWTPERQRAWWNQFTRDLSSPAPSTPSQPRTPLLSATLRIDWEQRT